METEKTMTTKRIILFVTFSFTIAWILFLLVPILGLPYGQGNSILLVASAMFAPTIGSILTRLVTKEGFRNMYLRPRFKGNGKYYVLMFFGPTFLIAMCAVFYFLVFPKSLDLTFGVLRELSQGRTGGLSIEQIFLIQVAQFVVLGPIINVIPTLGEELGWRGYLLPKLREKYSDRAALVVTGIIWGIWHAPVIMQGHNYGLEYWGYPYMGIFAMVVFCVALGIIEGYFTIKLKSAIPAAIIHSSVNAGAGLAIFLSHPGYNMLLGPAITGLVGGFPLIVLAIVLFFKSSPVKNTVSAETQNVVK